MIRSTLLVFALTGLFSACVSNNSEVDNGQKILNQISGPIENFDPQLKTGLAAEIQLAKVYEPLLQTHPFNPPFEVLPNLAQALPEVSDDGLTYTFHIQKGVYYHPCQCFGNKKRELMAEDFATTFKRIADPKLVSPHYSYWQKYIKGLKEWYDQNQKKKETDYQMAISGVTATDAWTLKIVLNQRNSDFLYLMTNTTTAPLPLEALEYYKNDLSQYMVGTGPFILKSYVAKSRIEFEKNLEYREKIFPSTSAPEYRSLIKESQGKKIPFLDKITVHIINESQTGWLNFMKGKLDYLELPKDNFAEAMATGNHLTPEMQTKGIMAGQTPGNSNLYYFGFNLKDPVMSDINLRKAIAYAFDHWKFNLLFFNGTADVAYSVLPPGIPGNDPPLKGPYVGPQLEKARTFLAKVKGEIPEITITVKNKTISRQVGEFFKQEMEKLGLRIRVEEVTWESLMQKAQAGNFMMLYLAWYTGIPTAHEFFELLYGPNSPDSYNRMAFKDDEFDRLFVLAKTSGEQEERFKSIAAMNVIAMENLPLLPLVHTRNFFMHQGWLMNYVPSEQYGGMEQYFDIDLKKKNNLLGNF